MKKIMLILFFLISFQISQAEQIKDGWNFGIFPVLAYDADLGFDYGITGTIFNFGDGSRYPQYDHSLYFVVSHYTKGSGVYRLFYDTDVLLDKVQISTDLTYIPDKFYDFIGFNGYESVFNMEWITDGSSDYGSRAFYKYDREFYRFKTDWQGEISSNLKWVAGIRLLNIKIREVDIPNLNSDLDESQRLPSLDSVPGLYNLYQDWGLIKPEEIDGGKISTLKVGLVYDTRDFRQNPRSGIWSELVFEYSPEFLGTETEFGKYSFIHRHYYTPLNWLILAGRFQYQGTIWGNVPFYAQPFISNSVLTSFNSEGLGGSRTLRGIVRNRIVGDDVLMINLESRFSFYRFELFNQNLTLGANSFIDMGMVTRKMPLRRTFSELEQILGNEFGDYFDPDSERLHTSVGIGFKGIMNENLILSIDYGFALNRNDGDSGFYVLMNYLF